MEYLVYRTLKQSGLMEDIRSGVQVVWDKKDLGKRVKPENELDALAVRASQLFGFSCKSGKDDITAALNEIDQYTRRLGGIFYHAALVVSRVNLDQIHIERAKQMKVPIFKVHDENAFREELLGWIQERIERNNLSPALR